MTTPRDIKWIARFTEFFWRYNKWFLLGVFGLMAVLTPFALRVKPDNSVDALSVSTDPGPALIRKVEKTFGTEEFISVSFEAPDIFSASSLRLIRDMTEHFEKIDGIQSVMSLTSIWKVESGLTNGEEDLLISDFIDKSWFDTGVPADKRPEVLASPLYQNLIYEKSGRYASIVAMLRPMGNDEAKRSEILVAFRGYLAGLEKTTGLKFHVMGQPVITRTIYETVEYEQRVLTVCMVVMIALLMFVVYRNWFVSLVPVLMLLGVFVFLLGTLGILGISLNWLTSIVPINIMIASVYEVIHVLNEFRALPGATSPSRRLYLIYTSVALPCLFTSLTTVDGFVSLISVPIKPINQFGTYVAYGIFLSFVLTFTFMLVLLNYGPKSMYVKVDARQNRFFEAVIKTAKAALTRHARKILVFCGVVAVFCVTQAFRIEAIEYHFKVFRKDDHGLKAANAFLYNGVGGGAENYVYLEGRPGDFLEPENLRVLERVSATAQQKIDILKKGLSVADLVKYLNRALHGNDPAYYRIPDTRGEVANILLVLEMQKDLVNLDSFISVDYAQAKVRLFSPLSEHSQLTVAAEKTALQLIKDIVPPHLKADFTSRPLINTKMFVMLPRAVIQSIALSAVVIMVMNVLLFRSFLVGLVAMIPNLFPILLTIGFMGFAGIDLNLATSMAFAVAIGLTVDNTIHLIWNMRKHILAGDSEMTAATKALDHIGGAAITSSLVLACGFLTFCFSAVRPTMYFGILVALALVFALFVTLYLTPILFVKLKVIKKPKGKKVRAESLFMES